MKMLLNSNSGHPHGDLDSPRQSFTTTQEQIVEDTRSSTRGTEEDAGSVETRGTNGRVRAKEAESTLAALLSAATVPARPSGSAWT